MPANHFLLAFQKCIAAKKPRHLQPCKLRWLKDSESFGCPYCPTDASWSLAEISWQYKQSVCSSLGLDPSAASLVPELMLSSGSALTWFGAQVASIRLQGTSIWLDIGWGLNDSLCIGRVVSCLLGSAPKVFRTAPLPSTGPILAKIPSAFFRDAGDAICFCDKADIQGIAGGAFPQSHFNTAALF